ncbi:DNA primase [Chlamydia abortus]|nr:DNA primase [Chlamydia abortus]
MGTNLSHYHLELLKNSTINLFFDSDKAGQESTEKNLKIILYYASKLNLQVNIVVNKLTKDPDELYNLDEGISLKETVKNKYDLSQYLINKYCSAEAFKEKNDIQKSSLLANMFEHAYYMQPQIYSLFKSKILESKILSNEVYNSFEKQYLKPNFSSDKNFLQHISKNEYEQYNQQNSNILYSSNKYNDYPNYNYEYHDYSEQNYNNLNFNSKPY